MKWVFPMAVMTALFTAALYAQVQEENENPSSGRMENPFEVIKVEIIDSVSDGCMPAPEKIIDAAEMQLRAHDFKITDAVTADNMPVFYMAAVGGRADSACVVGFEVVLQIYTDGSPYVTKERTGLVLGAYEHTYYQLRNTVLRDASSDGMQAKLEQVVRESINSLSTDVQGGEFSD
ncbi:MAG: hypothetical protein P8M21_08220 [Halioglobus sp.]|nr:hypothetical protein [Halioglobus sp.]